MIAWFKRLFDFHNYPSVKSVRSLHGGDIHLVYQVETNQGSYCMKVSKKIEDSHLFSIEKKSLNYMVDKAGVNVPQLYLTGEFEGFSFLMMTYIPQDDKEASISYWNYLAKQVANLHKVSSDHFGLSFSNYIGPITQDNRWKETWSSFYVENRLEPQVKSSFDSSLLSKSLLSKMEGLYSEIPSIFPEEKPSLLHGDLWSGNVIKSADYRSFFIDPAIYYGHREMDLAMMQLFGGFDTAFFESYQEEYSLEKGWEERVEIAQLYPLLIHLNLFGASYLPSIKRIVNKF